MRFDRDKLDAAKDRACMTVREICGECGLSLDSWHRATHGADGLGVRPATFKKICDVLGVEPEEVMLDEGKPAYRVAFWTADGAPKVRYFTNLETAREGYAALKLDYEFWKLFRESGRDAVEGIKLAKELHRLDDEGRPSVRLAHDEYTINDFTE